MDENENLMRAVREAQLATEHAIEALRMVRADLDNAVATTQSAPVRRTGVRRIGLQ
jgi:hypothetical protein